jgi:transcriptional regulator with XRE-family HTH domain
MVWYSVYDGHNEFASYSSIYRIWWPMARKKYQDLAYYLGLAPRLRDIRKAASLSQEGIGKILGFGKSTVSKFESGIMIPDMETIQRYAEIGETDIERLLHGNGSPQLRNQNLENPLLAAPPFDVALLAEVLTEIKKVISHRRLKLSPEREARLVALVFDHCLENKAKPDRTLVDRFLWITKVD